MKNILIITLIIFSLISCSNKTEETKNNKKVITFLLDWTPNTNHTGIYVALEKNYFKEFGINQKVEIIQPQNGSTADLVAQGIGQFGISFQESITPRISRGDDVIALATILQNNTSQLASLKTKNIIRPIDFANKNYCGYGGLVEESMVKALFKLDKIKAEKEGINVKATENDIKFAYLPNGISLFSSASKICDIFWIYSQWQGVDANIKNIPINTINIIDFSEGKDKYLNFYSPIIISSNKLIKQQPEMVRKFMQAIKKGYIFAINNPHEAAEILIKHAPEINAELILASQKTISKLYSPKNPNNWGLQKTERYTKFNKWALKIGLIKKEIESNKMFSNKFIQ